MPRLSDEQDPEDVEDLDDEDMDENEDDLDGEDLDDDDDDDEDEEADMSAGQDDTREDVTRVKGGVRGDDDRAAEAATQGSDDMECDPHQDELLDEGVEETFPASDPVSVKRIT